MMGGIAAGPNTASECYQSPNVCDGPLVDGACCNPLWGNCRNFVQANCQGGDEVWTSGVLCDELDPPCGAAACCFAASGAASCDFLVASDCAAMGGDPQAPGTTCDIDTDVDAVPDLCDNCPDHPNSGQENQDDDDWGDECDNCPFVYQTDQANGDTDIWGDACDNCPNVGNGTQFDSDAECDGYPGLLCGPSEGTFGQYYLCPGGAECISDGYGDVCDNCVDALNPDQADGDSDMVGDVCDNCISVPNTNQDNADGDSCGDACDECDNDPDKCLAGICGCNSPDIDTDGDGVYDCHDNCITTPNPGQENCDGDADGDACDSDIDNDGVTNSLDVCDYTPPLPTPGGGDIVRDSLHPLYGTLLGDLDGDCDVDDDDAAIFNANMTGAGCADGTVVGQDCAGSSYTPLLRKTGFRR